MLAHLSVYGFSGLLVIVGTCLQDELPEKTELCRTLRHPRASGRPSLGRQRGNPIAARENAAYPPDTSEKSRLPGRLGSDTPAKVLVFMRLFRSPPHYVMRCGPIDLVTMSP